MSIWVKPGPHMHIKHKLRFPPQYHTSYKWGYHSAPLHINVASGFCVRLEDQWQPLDCALLKDNNRALVAKSGLEINSRACLCVLPGLRHITKCWLSIQHLIFLFMFCLETPKKGSGPTNFWTEPSLASLSAISFSHTLACPGTQYSPTVCGVEMSAFHGSVVPRQMLFWQPEALSEPSIRANTNTFLWPVLSFSFMNTGSYCIYLSLKDCSMFS